MDDDSSLVIHQFIDKYDDSSYKMSKKANNAKKDKKRISKESGELPRKRKRKPKPPDMPRRPLSAYNIFFKEQRALIIGKPVSVESVSGISRPQIMPDDDTGRSPPSFARKKRAHRKTHGKISFGDLAKQIGAAWNNLSLSEKKKYADGASKEKARYQDELQIYRIKKKKEKEDEVTQEKVSQVDHIEESTKDSNSSGKRRRKYPCDEQHQMLSSAQRRYIQGTPSGLTIEVFKTKKPKSRLRGRRYQPMNRMIPLINNTQECDSIYPLPLNFDASRCHPSQIVNERDVMKAVSPLFHHPSRLFSQEPCIDHFQVKNRFHFEDKLYPIVQSTSSNVSAHSGKNSVATEPDNEMADIFNFFMRDGDVEKKMSNNQIAKASSSTVRTDNVSELYAI